MIMLLYFGPKAGLGGGGKILDLPPPLQSLGRGQYPFYPAPSYTYVWGAVAL